MNKNIIYLLPVIIGLFFFLFGINILINGHLHEDAYILFQFSRNFASGNGITFDKVSGPIEGATDFLWMISIGLISKLTGDFAISALILNSLGLAILIYLIINIREKFDLITLALILAILISGGTSAALGGFSTLTYAALYALLTINSIKRKYIYITIFAICLPLFRPDGAILTFGTLLSLLIFADKTEFKKIVASYSIIIFVGVTYFLWRWNYFGVLLPLPLLVKQKTDYIFEGLLLNFNILKFYVPLLLSIIYFWKKDSNREHSIILLGPFLLFIALSFMHQSQNVGYRFQFVIIVAILIQAAYALPLIKDKIIYLLSLLILITCIPGTWFIYRDYKYLTNSDYINSFPQLLKKSNFQIDKIAITEAGRFPFWYNTKKMIDLVGLNSREIVLEGPNTVLEREKPKLIFLHHAGRFNYNEPLKNNINFTEIDTKSISLNKYEGKNPVSLAPAAALNYAQKNNYRTVIVRYGDYDEGYSHVYFLDRTLDINLFKKILDDSFKTKISYFDSLKLLK